MPNLFSLPTWSEAELFPRRRRNAAALVWLKRSEGAQLSAGASPPSHRVLQTADGAANLPADLVRLAFGGELLVAGDLSGNLFDLTLGLLGRTFDAILVHGLILQSVLRKRAAWREVPSAPARTLRCASRSHNKPL